MPLVAVKDPERNEEEQILLFMDDVCRRFEEQFGRKDNLLEAVRNARQISYDEIFGPPLSPSFTPFCLTLVTRAPRYGNA